MSKTTINFASFTTEAASSTKGQASLVSASNSPHDGFATKLEQAKTQSEKRNQKKIDSNSIVSSHGEKKTSAKSQLQDNFENVKIARAHFESKNTTKLANLAFSDGELPIQTDSFLKNSLSISNPVSSLLLTLSNISKKHDTKVNEASTASTPPAMQADTILQLLSGGALYTSANQNNALPLVKLSEILTPAESANQTSSTAEARIQYQIKISADLPIKPNSNENFSIKAVELNQPANVVLNSGLLNLTDKQTTLPQGVDGPFALKKNMAFIEGLPETVTQYATPVAQFQPQGVATTIPLDLVEQAKNRENTAISMNSPREFADSAANFAIKNSKDGTTSALLNVTPEALGSVSAKISISKDINSPMTLTLTMSNPAAMEIAKQGIDQLQSNLAQAGLPNAHITIRYDAPLSQSSPPSTGSSLNQSASGQQSFEQSGRRGEFRSQPTHEKEDDSTWKAVSLFDKSA